MHIDATDRQILFELDRNARLPDTQLAKRIRKSKEATRYRIKKLEEARIITSYSTWIDLAKLGYHAAKIYLSLANKPEQKKAFIDYVTKDKRLFWLGIAEGAWNAGLTYFVKDNKEFYELKNELFSTFKELILESRTGILIDVHICEKTFLYQQETDWQTIFSQTTKYDLDDLEKNILKDLHNNARSNITAIAKNHNTTVEKVRHRMKRLEQASIIATYKANTDFSKLGYEFYKTFLFFKNLSKKEEARLKEYCRKEPNIIHLVRHFGEWDIELEIMCQTYLDYNEIISKLTETFADSINKVETAIMSEDYVFPAKTLIFN